MKREIKFRAYGSFSGKMYSQSKHEDIWSFLRDMHGMDIMQYTGLKDYNGVEIYEEDIVYEIPKYDWHDPQSGTIYFKNGSWKIKYSKQKGNRSRVVGFATISKRFKVIGNVYQNPELNDNNTNNLCAIRSRNKINNTQ